MKCPKCQTENPDTVKFCGECGTNITSAEEVQPSITKTIETPREELTTGSTFAGRYQIIEELGKGGMGKVYKAVDTRINEKIALKLIKPEISSDKKTLERFGNELKLARKIAHKNVGKMFDINEEQGTHYITMEYVSGQDLKGLIRQTGQLAIGTSISIAKQICEGLSEAHKAGVVHRDLKPNNIMIDREGEVRIMDFGIARSLKEKGITGAGVMIGTPEYMSPEQAEAKEIDHRSDLYSLGVILYEMLTGRVPFEGDTALSIAMKHKGEAPKNPKEYNTQIPDDLSRQVMKCLEKDRDERYQSAGELYSQLGSVEKGIPTSDRVIPKKKPITSKEITVTFGLRRLLVPVLIFVGIIIAGIIVLQLLPEKESLSTKSEKISVAILPFEDLTPENKYEYLCDGMAETLINSLSPIKEIKVPARTSAFSFKGKEQDIREIGQKLDVENVLEGSVQVEGNRIRITARLSNAADGFQIWSDSYNRELGDIFAIQDEIAQAIVRILKIQLLGEEREALVRRHTEDIEAYNLYLQGRFLWNKRTEDGLKKAIEKFELALKLDPRYAVAFVGISDCYNLFPVYAFSSSMEAFPRAKEAVMKALQIDPSLAEAHTSLGWIKLKNDWDWEGAEREFKHAIELNPGYSTAHHWYGCFLYCLGRTDESKKELEIALELDPVSLVINKDSALPYSFSRQYDKAIEILKNTIDMDPNFPGPHFELGIVYLSAEMYEDALKALRRERNILADWNANVEALIGIAHANMGIEDEARLVLDDIIEHSKYENITYIYLAMLYFNLGERTLFLNTLEKAFEERESPITFVLYNPIFHNIRSDEAFSAYLKILNLPELE
jgi:serine/threonine protein kinase/lipoprotein NlpI